MKKISRSMSTGAHAAYVGTAGWAIPGSFASLFPEGGSHLERYARAFRGVEINSSFYRDHQEKTYARWSAAVPADFRFSVKLAKEITHEAALAVRHGDLSEKIQPVLALGEKLGVFLIQLPPSLEFSPRIAGRFFEHLRNQFVGRVALEPRHLTWASEEARRMLSRFRVSKVIADPERVPLENFAIQTAGGFYYIRLHGSPIIYRSEYSDSVRGEIAETLALASRGIPGWCIFDNTTFGFASSDAYRVQASLAASAQGSRVDPTAIRDQ